MYTHTTAIIIASLVGLLVGLLIAEFAWKKSSRHASHVVPATIVNNHYRVVKQKYFYFAVLLSLIGAQVLFSVHTPEPVFWLIGFAVAGGDVQLLANKFFRLK